MARVIVLREGSTPRAITLAKLRESGTATLGDVKVTWEKGVNSALDTEEINQGREVGTITATRMVDGKSNDVVHDVTFAFVYHAFHPKGDLLR